MGKEALFQELVQVGDMEAFLLKVHQRSQVRLDSLG